MSNALYIVGTHSLKSAERNGGSKPYLARLTAGPHGSVSREFVRARKRTGGSKTLESHAKPGDVFEARRWLWDETRQQYSGGTVWFGVQKGGALCILSRDEAFHAVGASAIATTYRPEIPDHARATRMIPTDLYCMPRRVVGAAIGDRNA